MAGQIIIDNYHMVVGNGRSSANPGSTFYPQVRTYGLQLLVCSLPIRRSATPQVRILPMPYFKTLNLKLLQLLQAAALKRKTSPARFAQLLQPSLAFCCKLQPMTDRHWLQLTTKC